MTNRLLEMDVLEFCRRYTGPKPWAHALLCDPPYHLTSIVKRFGKKGSAPAQHGKDGAFARLSKGFMGQQWDGGEVSFNPETWRALAEHLYPGAFGMAFASSRGWHRLAVAIEDAGLIIHPSIFGWANGQGYPKASRVKGAEDFKGYRYGGQALKPALEPIIVFQKPYDGSPAANILDTGAGTINVDGGRVGTGDNLNGGGYSASGRPGPMRGDTRNGKSLGMYAEGSKPKHGYQQPKGRWPANLYLQHDPLCQLVGWKESGSYAINRFDDGAKPFGHGAGHKFHTKLIKSGREPVYACVPECPVRLLGSQASDTRSSGYYKKGAHVQGAKAGAASIPIDGLSSASYNDNGNAARYYHNAGWSYEIQERLFAGDSIIYQGKASRREKDAGLDDICPHPTVKPIELARWLATLLLPPASYAPRKLLVPFAGVGSEMIGAVLAGWEVVLGIEREPEYASIGQQRIAYWLHHNLKRAGGLLVEPEHAPKYQQREWIK